MQQQWIRYGILVLLLALAISGAQGATIVVAPSGGDVTALQPAVDAASPGDTIEVMAGTYAGDVVVRTPVSIIGTEGAIVGRSGDGAALIIEADNVTVRAITCKGPEFGIIFDATSGSSVRECRITSGDTGILLSGCTDCSISDTSIITGKSGLVIGSSARTVVEEVRITGGVTGIVIRDSDTFALRQTALIGCDIGIVADRAGNGTLEGTTLTDVGAGFLGMGITDTLITGSTVSGVIQYLQMFNALGCRVEAPAMQGPDYFTADVFSDTEYASGPWTVSGWNYALTGETYAAPEGYLQFGDALHVTIIGDARSETSPFIVMEAEVAAGDLEGYDPATFGFYHIDGAEPVPAGGAPVVTGGQVSASATGTAEGSYALLVRTEAAGFDWYYLLMGILAGIVVLLIYLVFVWRRD
ncbi:MAG TPA: hypothetical protein ENN44_05235 [Methanoculleus sp.]|nr:hypothetical protein [Methanoculleus sp.]